MSVQHHEGNRKIKSKNYENLQQMTQCATCTSNSCSCDLGSRSSFDKLQFQSMVLGKNNYAFDKTRKLNLKYSNLINNEKHINEEYSGMIDNNNPYTYKLWPPKSCGNR